MIYIYLFIYIFNHCIDPIVVVRIWTSDGTMFLLRRTKSVFYICSRTVSRSCVLCTRAHRMSKQELIYVLVMIGVAFFIFRFWSLTVLLLCWQTRIHNSEPWYRRQNTKADERHPASTSDLSCDSNVDLHKHTCAHVHILITVASILPQRSIDVFPNKRSFKGQVKPHYAIKPKLLLQCHKNDFLWAKEMTTRNTEQRLLWSHFIIHVDASGKLLFPQKLKGETLNVTNLNPYWARTMLWMCSIHI